MKPCSFKGLLPLLNLGGVNEAGGRACCCGGGWGCLRGGGLGCWPLPPLLFLFLLLFSSPLSPVVSILGGEGEWVKGE